MTENDKTIDELRRQIPSFACTPGCHDCCGPVTASSEEMARLPYKSDEEHDKAFAELNCPHLGDKGCTVYAERPLICRLFGTTNKMACPNGCRPETLIDEKIEQQIHLFNRNTRQLLL